MRTLCKDCLSIDAATCVLTIAIIGTRNCNGCGKEIRDGDIFPVPDEKPMAQYWLDLKIAKETCREAVADLIRLKVEPLSVYIHTYRGITLMVPVDKQFQPVEILGNPKTNHQAHDDAWESMHFKDN